MDWIKILGTIQKLMALVAGSALMIVASPAWTQPPEFQRACEVYSLKSQELGCEQGNFLEAFGRYYCEEFVRRHSNFSPLGKRVLNRIRPCLVGALLRSENLTCSNAKTISEKSHVGCYVGSGFCSLGMADKWQIFKTVWTEIFDSEFRAVAAEITAECNWLETF